MQLADVYMMGLCMCVCYVQRKCATLGSPQVCELIPPLDVCITVAGVPFCNDPCGLEAFSAWLPVDALWCICVWRRTCVFPKNLCIPAFPISVMPYS